MVKNVKNVGNVSSVEIVESVYCVHSVIGSFSQEINTLRPYDDKLLPNLFSYPFIDQGVFCGM